MSVCTYIIKILQDVSFNVDEYLEENNLVNQGTGSNFSSSWADEMEEEDLRRGFKYMDGTFTSTGEVRPHKPNYILLVIFLVFFLIVIAVPLSVGIGFHITEQIKIFIKRKYNNYYTIVGQSVPP